MHYSEIIKELEAILDTLNKPFNEIKSEPHNISERGQYPYRVGYASSQIEMLIERIKKGG